MTDPELNDNHKDSAPSFEVKPLDAVISLLVNHFNELVLEAQDIDMEDESAVAEFCFKLVARMTEYMYAIEGIDFDDEVIVRSGSSVILANATAVLADINTVADDAHIRGTIGGITVTEIPDESVSDPKIRIDFIENNEVPLPVIHFGLLFVLDNTRLEGKNGKSISIPKEITVCAPLNYPKQRLQKVYK